MTELQESLKKCKVQGNTLSLPPISEGILQNYKQVRQALINAGAVYKRNTFVFPNDAQPYIDRLMGGDKVNIKKEFQFFATPAELADELVMIAEVKNSHKILEPSAGQGAIVDSIIREVPSVFVSCYELMDINKNILSEHPNVRLLGDDFLKIPKKYKNYFDRIIANPPFNKNQDIDHIMKMYDCLNKKGRLVSVASKHWQQSSRKKEMEFVKWLKKVKARVEDVDAGAFK